MERNVMTFRILSSSECFYVIFKQNDQLFLPFSVNCSQVAMFQIMPAFVRTDSGREGGRVVNQMWTGLGRGRGSEKFPNLCEHPLWMTPYIAYQLGRHPGT